MDTTTDNTIEFIEWPIVSENAEALHIGCVANTPNNHNFYIGPKFKYSWRRPVHKQNNFTRY